MKAVTIFGSNSGNKRALIDQAIQHLSKVGDIVIGSSFYETEPWGFTCQENFLNQITVFETSLSAIDFLRYCLKTETLLGRVRLADAPRYSSRPIDIDLLFFDAQIIQTEELFLPHPRIQERNFVLTPLMEIMPDFVHPVFHKTISQLFYELTDSLEVKKIDMY